MAVLVRTFCYRDFASLPAVVKMLRESLILDYRNFEQVVRKARMACFNSGQRVEDHFVDITEMIEIGKGGGRWPSRFCRAMPAT